MKNIIFLIVFITSITNVIGQPVYFPSCEDLKITEMRFDTTSEIDTMFITVYNDCDTCHQHVYTGLLVTPRWRGFATK
jgi:cbb3-type cytochrome oxidase cytochrome c subunit